MSLRLTSAVVCLLALSAAGQQGPVPPPAAASAAKPSLWTAPSDTKAQKTYQEALDLEAHHRYGFALDGFRKADKQDGNQCSACADKVLALAESSGDFKLAETASQQLLALATTPEQQVAAHVDRAVMLRTMGRLKKKPDCFAEGAKEAASALAIKPGDRTALYAQGVCLAEQQQDDAARQVFASLLPRLAPHSVDRERIARYAERPELVRARLAPAFSLTTLDGQRISMDGLRDKVVLIDFWATWCGPCREALPHVRKIAKQYAGQPLVVLSISLDTDEQKWKDFVSKNDMTWLQSRDDGFNGPIAQLFEVRSIPRTFTIDSDGVLQDEHIGDGNIEGKLKKFVLEAQQRQESLKTSQVAASSLDSQPK